jgi:hypothetical protein
MGIRRRVRKRLLKTNDALNGDSKKVNEAAEEPGIAKHFRLNYLRCCRSSRPTPLCESWVRPTSRLSSNERLGKRAEIGTDAEDRAIPFNDRAAALSRALAALSIPINSALWSILLRPLHLALVSSVHLLRSHESLSNSVS